MKKLNVGIVGATGMVGEVFLSMLEERNFPVNELRLFASQVSAGKAISFAGKNISIQTLAAGCFDGLDLVFFSSGDDISKEWAPQAARAGAWAVDNSGAFRMDPHTPLVVPEINGHLLQELKTPGIIANPNCSTIQLVVALNPLYKKFGLNAVRVSSYQSVSGAGRPAVEELSSQVEQYLDGNELAPKVFPHPIAFNCIPQIGSFDASGFCTEELKIMRETRKIMSLPQLKVSAFTVRVPTLNCHAETVWATLGKQASEEEITSTLAQAPGVTLANNWTQGQYPMMSTASGKDPVFVGRIHRDPDDNLTWMFWVVADNLRKGAALNGIQIAEEILKLKS